MFRHKHHWRDHDGGRPPSALWGQPEQFRLVPFYCDCGEVGHIERAGDSWSIVVAAPNDPVRNVEVIIAVPLTGPPYCDEPDLDAAVWQLLTAGLDESKDKR